MMRKEFLDRGFVHIKNNKPLSNIDLKNIVDEFGDMYVYPDKYNFVVDNSFSIIRKDKLLGDSKLEWHKDMIHTSPWYAGTLLYCEEPSDMPTDFCYTMNSSLIDKVYKHGCFSGATLVGNKEYKNEAKMMDRLYKNPKLRKRAKHLFTTHLLDQKPEKFNYYINHPITNEKCVSASPATMIIESEERTSIIDDLLSNNKQFSHNWNKYDIIIYDNYKLMHSRQDGPGNRKLIRINFNYDNIL